MFSSSINNNAIELGAENEYSGKMPSYVQPNDVLIEAKSVKDRMMCLHNILLAF